MAEKLTKFIKNNREKFEQQLVGKGLWEKIENELNKKNPTKPTINKSTAPTK